MTWKSEQGYYIKFRVRENSKFWFQSLWGRKITLSKLLLSNTMRHRINSYEWNIRGAIFFISELYLASSNFCLEETSVTITLLLGTCNKYFPPVLKSRNMVFFTVSGGTLLYKCDFETSFCLGKSGPGTVSFFRTQVSILYFSIESQDFQNSRACTVFRCQCIFTRKMILLIFCYDLKTSRDL